MPNGDWFGPLGASWNVADKDAENGNEDMFRIHHSGRGGGVGAAAVKRETHIFPVTGDALRRLTVIVPHRRKRFSDAIHLNRLPPLWGAFLDLHHLKVWSEESTNLFSEASSFKIAGEGEVVETAWMAGDC